MIRIISLAILIGGIVLIIYGFSATDSISSDFSRFFTGSPTEKAIWMIIGGVVLTFIGLTGTVRGRN